MTTVTNKDGIAFDIDALATDVNGKVDKDLVNCTVPYVMSRTQNSYDGVVEIWSDGYCVQTGKDSTGSGSKTITLSQPYITTNYMVLATSESATSTNTATTISDRTTSTFKIYKSNSISCWRAEGYIR